jgi:hypothetical protein
MGALKKIGSAATRLSRRVPAQRVMPASRPGHVTESQLGAVAAKMAKLKHGTNQFKIQMDTSTEASILSIKQAADKVGVSRLPSRAGQVRPHR